MVTYFPKKACVVLIPSVLLLSLLLLFSLGSFSNVEAVYTGDPESTIFYDYDQLVDRLYHIESVSDGKVELEVIGQSNLGRDIYLATVGTGDKPVLIFTQQHGNEPHGTQAALNLLEDLATSDDPVMLNILEELTVHILPRLNPDGSEPDVFTRQNVDPLAPPANSAHGRYSSYGVGWDLNRYHTMNWDNHPLSTYSEFSIMTDEFGLVLGRTFDGSVDHDGEEGVLIDCGDGMTPEDFPPGVEGNIALVERNGTLNDKAANAEAAGAIGFILYQKDPDDTILPRLTLSSPPGIPATVIPRDRALEIIDHHGPVTGQFITQTYDENPATESLIMQETVIRLDPVWIIDSHNQGTWFSCNDRVVTSSMGWGSHPETDPEVIKLSKQVIVAMMDHMEQFEEAELTLYAHDTRDVAKTARAAYTEYGVPTILMEHWNNYTHPQIAEILIDHAYEQMYISLVKTADGSLYDLNPDRVDDMAGKVRPRPSRETAEGLFELMGYLDRRTEDTEGEEELPSTGAGYSYGLILAVLFILITVYYFRLQGRNIVHGERKGYEE